MLNPPRDELTPHEGDELDLGNRLRSIREHNGLSQRELAKRAGVPHSSISMIEQGLSSPTLNSLAKILNGFPMSVVQFFSCDLSLLDKHIYRAHELPVFSSKQGVQVQRLPKPFGTHPINFKSVLIDALADTGFLPQHSDKSQSFFVVKGSLEVTLGAEVSLLEEGDAFIIAAQTPYRLRNLSSTVGCQLVVCEDELA